MIKKNFKTKFMLLAILLFAAVSSLAGSFPEAEAKPPKDNPNQAKVKNVIFMVGDGMGPSFTSAYRYLKNNSDTQFRDRTAFDDYLVGRQMTYSQDPQENITDSAAAATAMSTGVKTYNNAVAVDNDGSDAKTVLEAAKEKGKATGLVATSEITHATPASYGAHNEDRRNMDAIADDYYDELIKGKHKVDVMLGGGKDQMIRDDRNIVDQFQNDGYSYVTNKKELLKDKNKQVLGLFADGGMPKMIDRTDDIPSLEDMTNAAIKRLNKNKDGFFLMVEGSQIDWAAHDNDIVAAMSEMEDFENAFKAAIDFAKKDKHTLVVATADHSTGGFTIGANDQYNWFTEPIKAAQRTPDFMASQIANGADVAQTLNQYIDFELTDKEIQSVKDAGSDETEIDNAIEKIFDDRTNTGWTTGGHTGEDVPVFAYGPQSNRFTGQIDNTDNAKIIFDLLAKGKHKHVIDDK
ncbi:alkaline phosphatase [Virgibacillus sp. 179-BFC.A HS]|uniref:Alkaline phosphatase n=1 Tax=Tigheibacillus jepli TaxID=3035914 RepID=A0ABU5CCZ5_9BACI|nr:alkaline phosphatase [Virgibacillus sp. 179-BFC.A HS]MDY0404209.1 alkaline phosphatase [Virgibacillus sp. 179-BFC.A HS]